MVKDSNTVVIGGLIDDTFSQTEYKVPCLGDVPGLGWLFKTRSKGNEKSNLYIFITPKVLQNPSEADSVSQMKKDEIDEKMETQIKLYRGGGETEDASPAVSEATGEHISHE
jgi:general secretion pathway protein D